MWVKAVYNTGTSDFGPAGSGTTALAAPGAPVPVGGDEQLTATWSSIAGATSYEVWYSINDDSTGAVKFEGDSNINDTNCVITDLENATTYYVWIKAVNSLGSSDFSESGSGTTSATAPGTPVVTGGTEELTVSWSSMPGAVSYTVWYSTTSDSSDAEEFTGDTDTAVTGCLITGLENGTVYYVWVKAVYNIGVSDFGPAGSGTTAPAVPGAPVLVGGDEQLTVTWSPMAGATSYEVWYSTTDDSSGAEKYTGDTNTTDTGCVITGLENDTAYYVWLKAVYPGGMSDFSGSTVVSCRDEIFQSVVQVGGTSGNVESTGLTLTFGVDPTTLTADDIIVTGARKGVLSGTGTTRTLAIADINVTDGGDVSVSITSPSGNAISGSPRTATVYRITVSNMLIGMDYRGGKLAYILQSGDTGYDANVPHGFIVATENQSADGIQWGGYLGAMPLDDMQGIGLSTGTAIGDGKSNTETIVNFFDTIYQSASPHATYYTYDWTDWSGPDKVNFTDGTNTYAMSEINNGDVAAKRCSDYEVVVSSVTYDDWYLPSKDELNELYTNRAAIGGFSGEDYWSSSGVVDSAWAQLFPNGGVQWRPFKDVLHIWVRAVRDF